MATDQNARNARAKRLRLLTTILQYAVATLVVAVVMFPIFWMIISSLKTSEELLRPVPSLWPERFHWRNYADALRMAPFGRYFFNTVVMTAGIMGLQLSIGSFAAYGFAKGRFPGRDVLFILVLGALMIPIQVTFVPIYVMVAKLGWINTFAGLIVPNAVSAYMIFMLRQTFKSVDDSFLEAARLEGMGRFGLVFKILVPMCKPTMLTVGIIAFIDGWNSYFWPKMVTTTSARRTIAQGVYELKRSYAGLETMNQNQIMAGAVMAVVPIIILFIVLQKYILTGFSKAASK
ncbi:MAG: carbohydrate ABC transporter permease [Spirochaetae bacterium HGW-Spirochaetae-3]|jgi:multiple sugar transport system permease protein/sn-glycerol 3-phosphate transport system permease protein|nr:MAG: carbohydrate ABC transporter permease [Spirochaetae bacterium HGW-Spirochaetae-3]